MNKQEFLSASLPYGLKVESVSGNIYNLSCLRFNNPISCRVYVSNIEKDFTLLISSIKPIVRHIDDLTKECVQADYNDGKPFVPITELLKNANFNTDVMSFEEQCSFSGSVMLCISLSDALLLIKWHFWPNMPENEEVVYVTEEFNPYK